ncbi:ABC transporter permease [Cohnella algarum]|uniref:ABC transporter permease n=1 Tax=Cohnella algarum TaxID=2044859 RepID=UPI001966E19C|nr:ABC transporter permease [Cohnella algarum]MBN2984736.1 ABC transporter permease [Cohnella algarum]
MNSVYLAWNLLKRMLNGKKGLLIHLVFPVAAVTVLIAVVGGGGSDVYTIAYANGDRGFAGEYLVREFAGNASYRLSEEASVDALKQSVADREATAGIRIPADFTERLLNGERPEAELFQLSVSEASAAIQLQAETAIGRYADLARTVAASGVAGDDRNAALESVLRQAEKNRISFFATDLGLVPNNGARFATGLLLVFLMINISSTVNLMMEDRRLRTMARAYTAPVRSWEITFGNFLGSFLAGSVQVVLVLLFARYVVGYDFGLPFAVQFLIVELFLLACVGMATAAAGVIRNSRSGGLLNSLLLVPTCMIGGCFWPVSMMPEWMQKLAYFVPQYWAIDAIEKSSAGFGFSEIALHAGILVVFAAVLFGFGSTALQPHKSEA